METAGAYAGLEYDGQQVAPWIVRSASREGEQKSLREAVGDQVVDSNAAARHTERGSRPR